MIASCARFFREFLQPTPAVDALLLLDQAWIGTDTQELR